jgi:hypothetical protein
MLWNMGRWSIRKYVTCRKAVRAAAVASVASGLLVTGCSAQEAICGDGEYPVKAMDSLTGGACLPDDEEPGAGFVRYPEGKVPKYVDDKWDKYWSTVIVEQDGTIVKG